VTIKLVDIADTRSLIERLFIPDEHIRREERIAKMVKCFQDAIDAFDHEEFADWMKSSDYSAQDIIAMCNYLEKDTVLTT
jgi:hypothetical protein